MLVFDYVLHITCRCDLKFFDGDFVFVTCRNSLFVCLEVEMYLLDFVKRDYLKTLFSWFFGVLDDCGIDWRRNQTTFLDNRKQL